MPLPASIAILNGLMLRAVDEGEAVLGEVVEDELLEDPAGRLCSRRQVA